MFSGRSELTSLDISYFSTSNVNKMGYMLNDCSKLSSLNLSNFDTSSVTSVEYMFSGCKELISLDYLILIHLKSII